MLCAAVACPRQLPLDSCGIGSLALEPAAISGAAGQFAEQLDDHIEADVVRVEMIEQRLKLLHVAGAGNAHAVLHHRSQRGLGQYRLP